MKKFNQLFKEEAPASDYKREKDSEDEVKDITPRSKEEEDFVKKHKVNKVAHPVAPDEQHTGDRKGGKVGKSGQDHTGSEESGEQILKTYAQFMKMGGFGGDSYKGAGNSGGEKAPVMQGSSKIKEEVEIIDEAFKAGTIRLKDGKTVKIDKMTAESLNNAMKQLNSTNRKRMETEAMKDKDSFDSMVKFAKAAV